jgi:hypothetical protein
VADPCHPADIPPRGSILFEAIRSDLAEGSDIANQAPLHPTQRTYKLVTRELAMRRRERDDHIENGRLRLAGECCVDLEQLTREYVALRP